MLNDFKYISYRRKSSESSEKQTLSLPAQQRELEKYISHNELNVIADLWESASAYTAGRPVFAEMMNMIKKGKANAILVCHLSRLSRNMTEAGVIIDMLKDGVLKEIRTLTETYTKNSSAEFVLALQFAMQKKSSDDTSEYVKRDINTKIGKGEYPGFASLGYLNITPEGIISGKQYTPQKQAAIDRKKNSVGIKRVEKDPVVGPLIKRLFELYATGQYTMNQLRHLSQGWGLFGGRSRKKLSKQTIQRILTNPFYYGAILFKGIVYEPESLPIMTRHDPIISRELFKSVQKIMVERTRGHKSEQLYPYSVYLKCGFCSKAISGTTAKGHHYYRCCHCGKGGYIREDKLEQQIASHIERLTVDDMFLEIAMEEISKENHEEITRRNAILNQRGTELKRLENELDALMTKFLSPANADYSIIDEDELRQRKGRILQRQESLKLEIESGKDGKMYWYESATDYVTFIHRLKEKFQKATPEKKREVFQYVFDNPTLTNKLLQTLHKNPHHHIISFNNENCLTLTANFVLPKTKVEALTSTMSHMRSGRDSNPRPLP